LDDEEEASRWQWGNYIEKQWMDNGLTVEMTRDKGLMVRNDELTTRNKWGTMGDDEG
jgi:hypothetical protein